MPDIDPALLAKYRVALQDLYDQLNQAYPVATGIDAKDSVRELAEAVFDSLTALNQYDIASITPQYAAIKATIGDVNQKLLEVQRQIDDWIHVVSVSVQLNNAIGKAIDLASKLFV